MPRPRPPRRWLKRFLAVVAGVSTALLLAESGLRVANYFETLALRKRQGDLAPDGRPLVAFIGDSHIYGVYVEESETLPKAFERFSKRNGGIGVNTINLGIPGAPSWVVLDQLERALALHPAAVVARCGFNNMMQVAPGEGIPIFDDLRLTKLGRIFAFNCKAKNRSLKKGAALRLGPNGKEIPSEQLRADSRSGISAVEDRGGTQQAYEIVWEGGTQQFEQVAPRLRRDLARMAELCRRAGTKLIMATYLLGSTDEPFSKMRDLVLSLDGEQGALVADCAPLLHRAITATTNPNDPRPGLDYANFIRGSLVFLDTHPTPLGYELEARVVAAAIKKSGAVRGLADEDPIVYLRQTKLAQPLIHQIPAAGDGISFSGAGHSDDRFTILVGHPGTCIWRNLALPIDLGGVLDSNADGFLASPMITGRVLAEIPPAACASWKEPLQAVAVVERGSEGWKQITMSNVVDVKLARR